MAVTAVEYHEVQRPAPVPELVRNVPVALEGEGQDIMSIDEGLESRMNGCDVERPGESERMDQVVDGAPRNELVVEPKTCLSSRQGDRALHVIPGGRPGSR